MKKKHKTHSVTTEHPNIPSNRRFVKLGLRIFVWILIISFVSTLGVVWEGQSNNMPVLIKTRSQRVDFSPTSFFSQERERINNELSNINQNVDPRVYNQYVNDAAFDRAITLALRNDFFKDIRLIPSKRILNTLTAQSVNTPQSMLAFYYAMQAMSGDLGVLPIVGEPSISDIYAFEPLEKMSLAAEVLYVSETNFYAEQISVEDKEQFFLENAEIWALYASVIEFSAETRASVKKAAELIQELGFDEALNTFKEQQWNKIITISSNYSMKSSFEDYNIFQNLIKTFKNKTGDQSFALSKPIYYKGRYKIFLVKDIGSYVSLPADVKSQLDQALVKSKFKKLSRQYSGQWKEHINTVKTKLSEEKSYSVLASEIPGLIVDVSQQFNLLQWDIKSVVGRSFTAPILSNRVLLSNFLYTPVGQSSEMISIDDGIFFVIKPLKKDMPSNNVEFSSKNFTVEAFRNIYNYKMEVFDRNLGLDMQKRYRLKSDRDLLTNLQRLTE